MRTSFEGLNHEDFFVSQYRYEESPYERVSSAQHKTGREMGRGREEEVNRTSCMLEEDVLSFSFSLF